MDEIKSLFDRLTELDVEICSGTAATDAEVAELEALAGAPMPTSYRQFLRTFGYAGPFDCGGFFGIDHGDPVEKRGVYAHSKHLASQHGFGTQYLVVYHDHDMETCWCIDLETRINDECPVVEMFLTPTGHTITRTIAGSFSDAVILYLKESITAEEEFAAEGA